MSHTNRLLQVMDWWIIEGLLTLMPRPAPTMANQMSSDRLHRLDKHRPTKLFWHTTYRGVLSLDDHGINYAISAPSAESLQYDEKSATWSEEIQRMGATLGSVYMRWLRCRKTPSVELLWGLEVR